MFISPVRSGTQLTRLFANSKRSNRSAGLIKRPFSQSNALKSSKLQAGDRVILKWTHVQRGKPQVKQKLTRPLRDDGQIEVGDRGLTIKYADIIGKEPNAIIETTSKDRLRHLDVIVRHPTLDEFISLAPRRVAPIYASYASTIVSMLEIHPDTPSQATKDESSTKPSLQILEAGTGQGGLTLHLARAIAAANEPAANYEDIRPPVSRNTIYKAGEQYDGDVDFQYSEEMDRWRARRNAVLHTIDIDPLNRVHADLLIRSFRNALYWPHINFYVGDVKDWVSERHKMTDGKKNFLDIVVLDMPGVEDYMQAVTEAVKPGGLLMVFQPQITQIAACVQEIATKEIDLEMETVLELGEGISNGRHWDVQLATLKSLERQRLNDSIKARIGVATPSTQLHHSSDENQNLTVQNDIQQGANSTGRIPPMVCRPLVGEMTRGGGFVGLWRKISSSRHH